MMWPRRSTEDALTELDVFSPARTGPLTATPAYG
jgi:hypothetical protein